MAKTKAPNRGKKVYMGNRNLVQNSNFEPLIEAVPSNKDLPKSKPKWVWQRKDLVNRQIGAPFYNNRDEPEVINQEVNRLNREKSKSTQCGDISESDPEFGARAPCLTETRAKLSNSLTMALLNGKMLIEGGYKLGVDVVLMSKCLRPRTSSIRCLFTSLQGAICRG